MSHDFEDIIYLLSNIPDIFERCKRTDSNLQGYFSATLKNLMNNWTFNESETMELLKMEMEKAKLVAGLMATGLVASCASDNSPNGPQTPDGKSSSSWAGYSSSVDASSSSVQVVNPSSSAHAPSSSSEKASSSSAAQQGLKQFGMAGVGTNAQCVFSAQDCNYGIHPAYSRDGEPSLKPGDTVFVGPVANDMMLEITNEGESVSALCGGKGIAAAFGPAQVLVIAKFDEPCVEQ